MSQENGSNKESKAVLDEFLGAELFSLEDDSSLKERGIYPTQKYELAGGILRNILSNREGREEFGHGVFERRDKKDILVWRTQSDSWIKPNFLDGKKFSKKYMHDEFDKRESESILKGLIIEESEKPDEVIQELEDNSAYDYWENNPSEFFSGYNGVSPNSTIEETEEGKEKEIERLIAGYVWQIANETGRLNQIYISTGIHPHNSNGDAVKNFGDFDVLIYNSNSKTLLHIECTLQKPGKGENRDNKVQRFVNTHNHLGHQLNKLGAKEISSQVTSMFFAPYYSSNHGMVEKLNLDDDGDKSLLFIRGSLPEDPSQFKRLIDNEDIIGEVDEQLTDLKSLIRKHIFQEKPI